MRERKLRSAAESLLRLRVQIRFVIRDPRTGLDKVGLCVFRLCRQVFEAKF
jgi:hypothetical protein